MVFLFLGVMNTKLSTDLTALYLSYLSQKSKD
uniref:Uncharacterized protein n=1 Tax=Anguilla anguilla TaxID=7936 RepID=A0A0E9PAF7_ANGAN